MASKKQPNPIDIHVGSRVRLRRMMLGMSQEKLGEHLGITFQQIQKYEKGTNRIGASRLQHIARVMNVPVSFFFEDAPGRAAPADTRPRRARADQLRRGLPFELRGPSAQQGVRPHQGRQTSPPRHRSGARHGGRRTRRLSARSEKRNSTGRRRSRGRRDLTLGPIAAKTARWMAGGNRFLPRRDSSLRENRVPCLASIYHFTSRIRFRRSPGQGLRPHLGYDRRPLPRRDAGSARRLRDAGHHQPRRHRRRGARP